MKRNFTLIICTFMRPGPLQKLLESVKEQILYPDEILIVDGSKNDDTKRMLERIEIKNLRYCKVSEKDRGLTKQRNYGVNRVKESSDVICFLDDDTILTKTYFKELIGTYENYPDALAVGGYIINEAKWQKVNKDTKTNSMFVFDGWSRSEPLRFRVRSWFGLQPDKAPGFLPSFSHGRSVAFLPPSGKTYPLELIMGGVSSYKKEIFTKIRFSNYFEGYGLYEDADFSIRLAKQGNLYLNTSAQIYHYHHYSGRPNKFKYGRMVLRNGYYIWRVKYPQPNIKSKLKWHATTILLIIIRMTNVFTSENKKSVITEVFGRILGWLNIILKRNI